MTMITRSSERVLKHWLGKRRRKPLVLRGARQVGKSTLVRQFAEHHGLILNEVDYVVSQGMRILPVEVKAGASGSLKSLQQFVLEKKSKQAIRFDLNPPSKMRIEVKTRSGDSVQDVQFELLSLPLYAVEALPLL